MNPTRLLACAAVVLTLLSGCDDDDGAPAAAGAGATVTGGVVKGPVSGSTVCAYAVSGGVKGAKLNLALPAGAAGSISGGCYVTPANGAYNFALPAGTTGDVLVEATGGTFCSNEATIIAGACAGGGTVLDLGGAVLTSVVNVSGGSTAVYTTPLTTAAVNANAGALSGTSFNASFNTLAGRVIGPASGVTPQTPPTAANQPYLAQVATYLQGGGTLTAAVSSLQQGTTTFPPPGSSAGSSTVTGTINPALVSTMQNLKFYVGGGAGCGTSCSYTDNQDVAVQIYGDGRISIAGTEYSGPFVHDYGAGPHLPEISWYDAAHDIEYALSDNEGGTFHEINVYKGRQPGSEFLGQIRMPISSVQAALAAIAGTYTPRGEPYAGPEIAWTSVTVASTGNVSFAGTGPSIPNLSTVMVFPTGGGGQVVRIYSSTDINGQGVDSYDQVAFFMDSPTHVKDVESYGSDMRVSGVSIRKDGEPALSAIGDPRSPSNWAITPNQITGVLSSPSATTSYAMASNLSGSSSGFIQVRAASGLPDWVIRLDDPVTAAQGNVNWSCVHGARDGRSISLLLSASTTLSSRNGGNCNIVVTSIVFNTGNANQIDSISGRFTAELYDDSRTVRYLVNNGAFNWTRPAP
ncbi:MAG: hypothetical protein EOO28_35985 [Comamonadaceae bacterium]|nr:MAG: hypothetical protein EOO28_35985 [Comamonadaceae bacterium]